MHDAPPSQDLESILTEIDPELCTTVRVRHRQFPALDPDELLSGARLAAWKAICCYQADKGTLKGWIMRAVHSMLIDQSRRHYARKDCSLAVLLEAHELNRRGDGEMYGIDGKLYSHTEFHLPKAAEAAEVTTPAEATQNADLLEFLSAQLRQLPEAHRRVLHLLFFEGLNGEEAARLLGVSRARICQIRAEGLQFLRELSGVRQEFLSNL